MKNVPIINIGNVLMRIAIVVEKMMKINNCSKCGYPLDSVDHHMNCNVPDKTWKSRSGSRSGEWD